MQFRDIISQVSVAPRPLLSAALQQACHVGQATATSAQPLQLTPYRTLAAAAVDVSSLQQAAHQRLLQQHAEVLNTPALSVFENIGELFCFMESFTIEEYSSAHPSSTDIMTDMTVMRTWLTDLEACPKTVSHKLFFFDLTELRTGMLAVARRAVRSFLRLVRESMYDKCIDLQVGLLCKHCKLLLQLPPETCLRDVR